jgi:hypothetical protein
MASSASSPQTHNWLRWLQGPRRFDNTCSIVNGRFSTTQS